MDNHSSEKIQFELSTLVRYITSVTDKRKRTLDRSGYLLLYRLYARGAAGVKNLAEEFHLDISTVSRQAAALETKGFVTKIPHPQDKRSYSYQLTELGEETFIQSKKERVGRIEKLINDWSEEDRRMFGDLLKKFNDAFE